MKRRLFNNISTVLFFVLLISPGTGQESTYLSQKLMLEKDLHSRIENALSKILDDQRYVLDVTVDLKFTPTIKEEVTFRPDTERPSGIDSEADLPKGAVSAVDDKTSRITGLPIPGFEFGRYDEDEPAVEVPVDSPPTPTSGESNIVTQSYTDIKSSLPKVERMEIGCILPEGSAPELIENVRQIIMVASKFDRSRGDVLSIMTASFKERKDEKTAEAVILRTIAHKIDSLENIQFTDKSAESDTLMKEWIRWQEEERSQREEEVAQLSTELSSLRSQLQEQEALSQEEERSLREEEVARLSSELSSLRNQLQEQENLLRNQLQEQEALSQEEERSLREEEVARLSSELSSLRNQLHQQEDSTTEEERFLREEEVARLSSELSSLRNQLQEQEDSTTAEEDEQQARIQDSANKIFMLQTRLDSLQLIASQGQEEIAAAAKTAEETRLAAEQTTMQPLGLRTSPQEESTGGTDNLPIYLMSAISLLAVIALAAVIIFNGRSKPKYVMPPPWMMPPPKKKKVKKTKKSKKDDKGQKDASEPPVTPVQQPQPQTQPEPAVETEEDTAVMQSEIRSARQSVVSMSVGQPNTATTIVREWLEQEAPSPTEAAQPAEAAPAEPEPEAEEEKGKKKKKKKKKK
jgi:flagellar biosynthesis/type III secretory pathway M-ring protein FliF/YscJ